MLVHSVALCQTPGLQPNSQNISNAFIACADLRLSMRPAQVEVLLKHLLGLPVSEVSYQAYSNVAWSLVVMGCLDISMFDAILYQLTKKHNQLLGVHGSRGTSAQPKVAEASQLHQVKPPQGSDQMGAWCSSHSRLLEVAPTLLPHRVPKSLQNCVMLLQGKACQTKLRLLLEGTMQMLYCLHTTPMYHANAVLSTHHTNAAQVILVLGRPEAYLTICQAGDV